MIRRSVAGAILGLSLLIGSFAWSGFLALRTVFDPDRSREIAAELLDNDEVRDQLSTNMSFAVRAVVPPQVPVDPALIDQVTQQLLESPAVEAAILNAFADSHAAFLGDGDAPDRIDLTAVAQVARETLVSASPELDGLIGDDIVLSVPLPTERIPNASPVRDGLRAVVPVLAALAIGGAVLALVTTTDRPAILRRAGFWALATTAVYLLVGIGAPYLLREFAPDQAEVVAALLAALLRSTLVPSIALGAVGVGLLVLSGMWAAAGNGGGRPARARPVPDPDAPHRRRVAAMDRQQVAPAPRVDVTTPPPVPRRAAAPRPPAVPTQPQPTRQQPVVDPGAARPPRRAAPPARPQPQRSQPAPDVPVAPSPYPDAEHWAATHPGAAPTPATHPAEPDTPHQPATASIFDDVPLPGTTEPLRPSSEPPPVAAAGAGAPPNSVFDTPAPPDAVSRSAFDTPAPDEARPQPEFGAPTSPSKPPAGARFDAEHGWVLDPGRAEAPPADAVWVDGVGWTLPGHR